MAIHGLLASMDFQQYPWTPCLLRRRHGRPLGYGLAVEVKNDDVQNDHDGVGHERHEQAVPRKRVCMENRSNILFINYCLLLTYIQLM